MKHFDLVVIGGGIHGAGVVQAAAAAGYTACLFEQRHPAAGTSSKSSKLIHGGLRYLETVQIKLVREALHERELLLKLAPELVRLVPFLIPVYEFTGRRPWQIFAGLALYQVLSGLRRSGRFHTLPPARWSALGGLKQDRLQAIFSYFDAQTDDAKLTEAVLNSAAALGASIRHPAEFLTAERCAGGYRLHVREQSREEEFQTNVLINACGPWVNTVQRRIKPTPPIIDIELVQGAHIEFDQPLSEQIFYVEAPRDRRAVFVLPWHQGTMVGTTETPFSGRPEDVVPLPQEVAYLEETVHAYFPNFGGKRRSQWAGLRVLPAGPRSPFSRSRETQLIADDSQQPHLVAIYGGKLTTYRATAARVMKMLRGVLPITTAQADTSALPLRYPS